MVTCCGSEDTHAYGQAGALTGLRPTPEKIRNLKRSANTMARQTAAIDANGLLDRQRELTSKPAPPRA
jgi:hypothetical protein